MVMAVANDASRMSWRAIASARAARHPDAWHAAREVVLVLVVTLAYFLTRGLARGDVQTATAHARALLSFEHALHLDPERAMQALALRHPWLTAAANLFYLVGHLPVLIATAVWLFWTRPLAYRWFRNAFLISALFGLSIYVVLPVAPPRYLPGFTDTLKAAGFNVDGSSVGLFYNPYAAMPSLHVGWALLAGLVVVVSARARWLRVVGAALPVLMALAVLMTGNHFLLDILAGVAIALVSLALSAWWVTWQEAHAKSRAAPAPDAESQPAVAHTGRSRQ
jgi:membrane-associated phospholipid phosphatase